MTVGRSTPHRLLGVDAARALALFGMMAVHITPSLTASGDVSTAYELASGRASALFAVLAGVGLALAGGGTEPPRGRVLGAAAAGTTARALVLLLVGLVVGTFDSGVAVILAYYALLFVVAAPFLGLRSRILIPLAVVWMIGTPFLSHALRLHVDRGPPNNPTIESLRDPGGLLLDLTLTGYYPVLQWTAYLLLGLGIGRLRLRESRVAWWLLAAGVTAAVVARVVSWYLLERAGGMTALAQAGAGDHPIASRQLETALETGFFGVTPTTSWWWLAVPAPHSGTTFDLAYTSGVAVAVLGAMLLIGRVLGRGLWPLAAVGSMTLTLYSLHVFLLATFVPRETPDALLIHILIAVAVAIPWRTFVGRGPLEHLAAGVSTLARESIIDRATPANR
ncbi:MAG TPA: heparan-alpha-glucosaminide N-acetyltransferase domain-containing protein [Jiangellaceae bacterium]